MEKLGAGFGRLALAIVLVLIMAWPTMWLWNNCLVGAIDGINPIGFWQAMGISCLAKGFFSNNNTTTNK